MGNGIKLEIIKVEPWMRNDIQIGYTVHLSGRGNTLTFDQLDMIARYSPVYKKLIDMNFEIMGAIIDLAEKYQNQNE